ncbi:MAG: peptidoglycan-binding protein LysM [Cardiobacteriales bacterium]|nr:MAG: peptidoglycan-binding protein LysM [Cardiobacteriales bacterium]
MKISPIHGLSVALAVILAGCTSPKEAFLNKGERPSEQCLPSGVYEPLVDHDQAFGDNFPQKYVVKKGDTLWGISKRFLVQPWYWKQVWYNNPHIRNPHLIYPGDVLSVVAIDGQKYISITEANEDYHGVNTGRRTADGRPIVKYSPHLRTISLADGPIAIAHTTIEPFLIKTHIYSPEAIENLPFIYGDAGSYITLSQQQEIYAKGLLNLEGEHFDIYRISRPIFDLSKQQANKSSRSRSDGQQVKPLGYQMDYIGQAGLIKHDPVHDYSILKPLEVVRDMRDGDVIVPISANTDPVQYFPQLPSTQCQRGYIVGNTNDQTLVIKEFDTLVTSFGADNGAQPGDVWKIARPGPVRTVNGKILQTPYKDVGYLMIYRVYQDVSLAFVLDSSQEIYETDHLIRP